MVHTNQQGNLKVLVAGDWVGELEMSKVWNIRDVGSNFIVNGGGNFGYDENLDWNSSG